MTNAPGNDKGLEGPQEPEGDELVDTDAEDAFFSTEQADAAPGISPLKIPEATDPKVKPMRVDPTPSEEFFGESLSKMVEEIDEEG